MEIPDERITRTGARVPLCPEVGERPPVWRKSDNALSRHTFDAENRVRRFPSEQTVVCDCPPEKATKTLAFALIRQRTVRLFQLLGGPGFRGLRLVHVLLDLAQWSHAYTDAGLNLVPWEADHHAAARDDLGL